MNGHPCKNCHNGNQTMMFPDGYKENENGGTFIMKCTCGRIEIIRIEVLVEGR